MARFSATTIEAVSDATDFVSIVEQYTKLEKRGSAWWGCCPFHNEKTASFQINPEKKLFYCFACHKGGSLFNFVMEMEQISFYQAVLELAKKANIPIVYDASGVKYERSENEKLKDELYTLYEKVSKSFHHILLHTKEGARALDYLMKRNVDPSIIENFMLGLAPSNKKWLFKFLSKNAYKKDFLANSGLFSKKYPEIAFFSNRIMFPIADRHGRIIAFGGRTLSNDPKSPKYLNSSDMPQYQKKQNLFALNRALPEIRKTKKAIICEGYMDVLAFHQAGITNAVAPLGTALSEEQVKILQPLIDTLYLCFDSDEAGVNASFRAIKICTQLDVASRIIEIRGAKDPAELLEKEGAEGLKKVYKNAIMDSDFFVQKAMTRFDVLTAEGKEQACKFLFPYLQLIQSNVKREALLSKFASSLNVSPQALYEDFVSNKAKAMVYAKPKEKVLETTKTFKKNAETRAMLAVIANPELFKIMRSTLSSDDFHDEDAKSLFIFMEECYRDEVKSKEELMSRLTDKRLYDAVTVAMCTEEFSHNPELIVDDGIARIKKYNLECKRDMLVDKLNLISIKNGDFDEEANDIASYINDLNRQIAEFKKN